VSDSHDLVHGAVEINGVGLLFFVEIDQVGCDVFEKKVVFVSVARVGAEDVERLVWRRRYESIVIPEIGVRRKVMEVEVIVPLSLGSGRFPFHSAVEDGVTERVIVVRGVVRVLRQTCYGVSEQFDRDLLERNKQNYDSFFRKKLWAIRI